ncbi:2-C-methyl-D-erythritol 4-phosphate cytidylyltransferase [Pengzhenrongella sicca]|uniref:2-C-methyl-D-erythritol 4-phosphate cytidylyltransferase n=1 Tax=Pengzhenrongella sicca TaxID=2819238 RepID=A0A8A4ZFM5_9MICO|nr:2-C-methyl-D-erythritol 4-phosphate cytidylyltransferase [Pengzhenrongella sicca]QTE29809.1 2-C-methyl-D-erythritol 4-phosphate cytidylyltransferase [Pengzhenrongella sicca]
MTTAVPRTAAVLTAAGSGSRFGAAVPKALVLLEGLPLVAHAARRLAESGVVDLIVVTAPEAFLAEFRSVVGRSVLRSSGLSERPESAGVPVLLTAGGASRQASVGAALAMLPPSIEVVLVHDAARPLAPAALVARVAAAVRAGHGAVIPGAAVTDTIVQVGSDGDPAVVANPDRSALRIVQTPQGFDRALLDRAHAAAAHRAVDEAAAATDDASLVAALGEQVHVVPGDPDAFKITAPRDLELAQLALRAGLIRTSAIRPSRTTRSGGTA